MIKYATGSCLQPSCLDPYTPNPRPLYANPSNPRRFTLDPIRTGLNFLVSGERSHLHFHRLFCGARTARKRPPLRAWCSHGGASCWRWRSRERVSATALTLWADFRRIWPRKSTTPPDAARYRGVPRDAGGLCHYGITPAF